MKKFIQWLKKISLTIQVIGEHAKQINEEAERLQAALQESKEQQHTQVMQFQETLIELAALKDELLTTQGAITSLGLRLDNAPKVSCPALDLSTDESPLLG